MSYSACFTAPPHIPFWYHWGYKLWLGSVYIYITSQNEDMHSLCSGGFHHRGAGDGLRSDTSSPRWGCWGVSCLTSERAQSLASGLRIIWHKSRQCVHCRNEIFELIRYTFSNIQEWSPCISILLIWSDWVWLEVGFSLDVPWMWDSNRSDFRMNMVCVWSGKMADCDQRFF